MAAKVKICIQNIDICKTSVWGKEAFVMSPVFVPCVMISAQLSTCITTKWSPKPSTLNKKYMKSCFMQYFHHLSPIISVCPQSKGTAERVTYCCFTLS